MRNVLFLLFLSLTGRAEAGCLPEIRAKLCVTQAKLEWSIPVEIGRPCVSVPANVLDGYCAKFSDLYQIASKRIRWGLDNAVKVFIDGGYSSDAWSEMVSEKDFPGKGGIYFGIGKHIIDQGQDLGTNLSAFDQSRIMRITGWKKVNNKWPHYVVKGKFAGVTGTLHYLLGHEIGHMNNDRFIGQELGVMPFEVMSKDDIAGRAALDYQAHIAGGIKNTLLADGKNFQYGNFPNIGFDLVGAPQELSARLRQGPNDLVSPRKIWDMGIEFKDYWNDFSVPTRKRLSRPNARLAYQLLAKTGFPSIFGMKNCYEDWADSNAFLDLVLSGADIEVDLGNGEKVDFSKKILQAIQDDPTSPFYQRYVYLKEFYKSKGLWDDNDKASCSKLFESVIHP